MRPSFSSRYWPVTLAGAGAFDQDRARGRIEGDRDFVARLVAGLLDGPEDDLDGGLVRRQRRSEAALVALADREALGAQDPLEGVEDLGAGAQGVGEGRHADRRDHELLEVRGVHGVLAAVEDVEERDRHDRARRRRRGSGRAASRSWPRPRGPPRGRRPGSRWRRACPCSGCRRGRSARRRGRPGRPRPCRAARAR